MCLLGLLLRGSDGRFLLLHIRDEVLRRPVQPPMLGMSVLGGVDLQAQGTWMGLSVLSGRFASLTNVRRRLPGPPAPVSRGQLIKAFLEGGQDGLLEEAATVDLGAEFAGFNAVFGDIRTPGSLKYVTNRVDGGDIAACLLPRAATLSMSSTPFSKASAVTLDRAGAHALSNSHLNDTSWPRVHFMEAEMQALQQVHVWGAPAATPTTLPPQLQPLQELPGVLAALRRVTRTLSAGNVTVPPFTSPAPRGLLDWSPLPEPLEVFLQSHCRLPIITQAFLSQTWLACSLSMLKRLLPGGLQTAAALSVVLLSVAWAGLFAVTPEAWGVTWRLASTLPLSLLGLAGAGAALASSAQRYVKALLPYGSRAASLLLRTQQGAWYAYAALDQGGGTVGAQREATVEELNAAVCEAVHVPSKDLPQTDLLPPGGLVVHRDRHGTLQLLPATQGTPAESLEAAATLPHTQRSLQVGDLSWQVFFSGGHVAASSERL